MIESNTPLHATGRIPSTIKVKKIQDRIHSSKTDKFQEKFGHLQALKEVEKSIPRSQSLRIFTKKSVDKPKLKVHGADIELQSVDEKFRNRTDNSKTTIITATRKYEEDEKPFSIDCNDLRRMVENSPISFRFLVICIAIFMVIASAIDYNKELYSNNNYYYGGEVTSLFFLISLYVWIFGAFVISLEMVPFRMGISDFHRNILQKLIILRFSWGRGCFYCVSGSLQFSLLTNLNMIAGCCMILLGIASVIIGRVASTKLKKLVRNIGNDQKLFDEFTLHDQDCDGYLSVEEFRRFVDYMDVDLTDDELHNVFMAIDQDHDRLMTFPDILHWYDEAKYEMKTDGALV